jgi:hypothetical protein
MGDISKHKARLRTKQRELRVLLNEWDPLNVAELVGDEYDCLLRVIGKLHHGSPEADVAAYFREELVGHFGIDPEPSGPEAFAHRVFDWYWADPLP